MSDHAWAQEQIAAHVDRGLEALFAPMKPAPALEDRMVRSLHVIKAEDLARRRWQRNLAWSVAASVGLGAIGAAGISLASDGRARFPWDELPGSKRVYRSTDSDVALFDSTNDSASMKLEVEGKDWREGPRSGIIQFALGDGSVRNKAAQDHTPAAPGSFGPGMGPVPGLGGGGPSTQYKIDKNNDADKSKKLDDKWGNPPANERASQIGKDFVPSEHMAYGLEFPPPALALVQKD